MGLNKKIKFCIGICMQSFVKQMSYLKALFDMYTFGNWKYISRISNLRDTQHQCTAVLNQSA